MGGLAFTQQEAMDFAQCINSCALLEVPFTGTRYTWWNGRIKDDCILKKLDRILVNHEFSTTFPAIRVQQFIRQSSDHVPLHVVCNTEVEALLKPFRFLNFWAKHEQFKSVVQQNWNIEFTGSPFMEVNAKLKKVKWALRNWSKETFGDIFR